MKALGLVLFAVGTFGALSLAWAVARSLSPRQRRRRRRLRLLQDTEELARIERNLLDTDPKGGDHP